MKQEFYSHGKLLLTAEYLVLDGADALAFPTKFGQSLAVDSGKKNTIEWKSYDHNESLWLDFCFSIEEIKLFNRKVENDRDRLLSILMNAHKINSSFLGNTDGFSIVTKLDFPNNWGLGTSSTLINNVSKWANLDPYKLLNVTFGGSGYDIACAQNNTAITYQLIYNNENSHLVENVSKRLINQVLFNPVFKNHLYFVYLNKKQDSREGIAQYKRNTSNLSEAILKVNQITQSIIVCDVLEDFNTLIDKHEQLISKIINQKPIKQELFSDFNGSIKSLGAWGGDFILATCESNPTIYFKSKGFDIVLSFDQMIKSV